jgi:Tol biopolymer transport system component
MSFDMAKLLSLLLLCAASPNLGVFESAGDVGGTPFAGAAEFDAARGEYRVTGGGANIWGAQDAFHFVWRRVSGDFVLAADVKFLGSGAVAHRKAALMFRQGLEPDAPYADVAVHGDGLTSLQFRPAAGAPTQEIQLPLKAPARIRIERRGDRFTVYAGNPGEELRPAGPVTVALKDPVYAGLAVCSHDASVLETAVFSSVNAQPPAPRVRSKLSVYHLKSEQVELIYTAERLFEAPNWSTDGTYLLINSDGALWRLPLDQKPVELRKLDLGAVTGCNNDHGFTRDGKRLAISARGTTPASQIYVAASDGAGVRLVTRNCPSYFHGWSPDGRWLAFVGQREGIFNPYRILADGSGEEQRLTARRANDDGPEYSPDGKWIYFNSDRAGTWDIWRMPAEGAGPGDSKAQRVTSDDYEDWFPHFSPDGKWMVFLSFKKGTQGHPANQDVVLRLMRTPGAKLKPSPIRVLTHLFGGQGSINVNSWSHDSTKFAFVSYELIP